VRTWLIIAASLVAWGCGCSERTVADVSSPNHKLRALAYWRNCGATSAADVTQVYLSPFPQILGGFDNNTRGASELLKLKGTLSVAVRWLDDEHLRITLDTRGALDDFEKPFVQETEWGNVTISYETASSVRRTTTNIN